MTDEPMNIALVFGCARSGTSILGELIGAHPDVRYRFEAHKVWNLAGKGPNKSHRLTAEHATPEIRSQIRAWFAEQQTHAPLVVEKTPRNALRVPFLRAVMPEAKIIHIVRDGRDVACSMLPGIGNDEWNHLKPPNWQTFFTEYAGIERCALTWKEVVELALADLADVPHLQVKYEELVADPRATARLLLGYLHLPPNAEVEAFCQKIQASTEDSYHAEKQDRWYRPDHRSRVERWRENLTPEQQEHVSALLREPLARLGYP